MEACGPSKAASPARNTPLKGKQNPRINVLSFCDFWGEKSSSLSKEIPAYILHINIFLLMNPDIHCKQQDENLVFKPQKLHQLFLLCIHVISQGWALWLTSTQIMKSNVYSYVGGHVLNTMLIQSICRK